MTMTMKSKRSVAGFALALLFGGAAFAWWAPKTPGLVQSVNIEAAKINDKEEQISDMSGKSESKWKAAEDMKDQLKAADENIAKAKGAERRLAENRKNEKDVKAFVAKPTKFKSAAAPKAAAKASLAATKASPKAPKAPAATSPKASPKANLASTECSLDNKEGCSEDERKILKDSDAKSKHDISASIKMYEGSIAELKRQIEEKKKALKKALKHLGVTLRLFRFGDEKIDKVEQLLSDADFKEHCEDRTCVLAFLPHIFDGGANERNKYLEVLKGVQTAFKNMGFMWLQGGDQCNVEEKMSLGSGYPAVVAVNKWKWFGVHHGSFTSFNLIGFLQDMKNKGPVDMQSLDKDFKWANSKPWDGKDGAAPAIGKQ